MPLLEPKLDLGKLMVIRWSEPFSLHELVQGLRKWLLDRKYDIDETAYKYRKGGDGFSFESKWKCKCKATTFIRKNLVLGFKIDAIKDIEVVVEGKKQIMQQSLGVLEIESFVEFGWQSDLWTEKHKKLLQWYLTYLYSHQYWAIADDQWYETQALGKETRRLLNFEVQ